MCALLMYFFISSSVNLQLRFIIEAPQFLSGSMVKCLTSCLHFSAIYSSVICCHRWYNDCQVCSLQICKFDSRSQNAASKSVTSSLFPACSGIPQSFPKLLCAQIGGFSGIVEKEDGRFNQHASLDSLGLSAFPIPWVRQSPMYGGISQIKDVLVNPPRDDGAISPVTIDPPLFFSSAEPNDPFAFWTIISYHVPICVPVQISKTATVLKLFNPQLRLYFDPLSSTLPPAWIVAKRVSGTYASG